MCAEMEPRVAVLVDDEPDILWVVGDVLESDGFQVLAFDHPALLDDLEGDTPAQLVVVDLVLPGMNGIETARRLHAHGFASTPMLAISASSEMCAAAAASGLFDAVLSKPFDDTRLLATVHTLVESPHHRHIAAGA